MNPASEVNLKCWLCHEAFKTRRQLKNHVAAQPHRQLSLVCVWCEEEREFRRMVNLKEHVMASHRSKMELMPSSFLTENNGFWMAVHPEGYAKIIEPSKETSVEAMKARIEVLEFVDMVRTSRTRDQWIEGWKCPKEVMFGMEEEGGHKRAYSPSRPTIFEDLELEQLTVGAGTTSAIFRLDFDLSIRDFEVYIHDEALKDARVLDNLTRRMTTLIGKKYLGSRNFETPIIGDQRGTIISAVARKLGLKPEYIKDIKTKDELFPTKKARTQPPLSPLATPSTSEIELDQAPMDEDDDRPLKEFANGKRKKHKKVQENKEDAKKEEKAKKEKEEQERREKAKKEQERRDKARMEHERKEKEEQEKKEKARREQARKEQERKERERKEQERKEREGNEQEEQAKKEQERTERERKEQERKEREGKEQEEQARKEQERTERERKEQERKEREGKEQEEQARKEQERKEREGKEQEEQARKEQERKERERKEQAQKDQEEHVRMEQGEQTWEDQEASGEKENLQEEPIHKEALARHVVDASGDREGLVATPMTKTPEERAYNLLSLGGMPLFPSARREWSTEEVVTLIERPSLKWPPKDGWR